ncbi:hypothetical protein BY996DRAFT_8410439 [Phakopsora pachyrhizi]|uniref:Expressed protein n=1 Tax=Phakopsora pachyrhizi TaxID=170000 RepID=A0AAV0BPZ6_PHAPC|nr:hypothetical protein BY996DRAFT_8410439 [Phakopsora pachyrhizi]CAH7688114.1 expressed protein [Phakopsora pachyrhizi]
MSFTGNPSGSYRRQRSITSPTPPRFPTDEVKPLPPPPARPRRSPINELCQRFSRPSLKREATSPVYLDVNTAALASMPSRRVAQCAPTRIRTSDSDVTSVSSQDETTISPRTSLDGPPISITKEKDKDKKKRGGHRNKWTKEETDALVRGCNTFAIGQWKAIRDSDPILARRSPGDLKDRFRTYFPDAYRQHYPNAKTHISSRVRSIDSEGNPIFGENAVRKERKQFSNEEDDALKRGYAKYGTAWSSIQRDPLLSSRKATDLRDRFRNAFPDLYAAAGYKPRPRKASGSNVYGFLGEESTQNHGTFEAIDLSLYSGYPSRSFAPLRPEQYQLPSLDFLKTHGAEAFSDFGVFLSRSPGFVSAEETGIGEENQSSTASAVPNNLSNTPRPNLTPRPNDTTPRPQKPIEVNIEPVIIEIDQNRPLRSLQKAQSSVDLTQFSTLHLVDSHMYSMASSSPMSPTTFSPTFTENFDLGASPPSLASPQEVFKSSPAKLAIRGSFSLETPDIPRGNLSDGVAGSPSDWINQLEIASQAFPGAFDLGTYASVTINKDVQSSETSIIHQDLTAEISGDKEVYSGNNEIITQQQSSFFAITDDSFSEGENNCRSEALLALMQQRMSQIVSSTGMLDTTLCPAPCSSQLIKQDNPERILIDESDELQRFEM